MYQQVKLSKLQNVQSKFFDALEQFIKYYNTEVDEGQYLSFINKADESFTFKIGIERFTIHSQINLKSDVIKFTIYAWIFDVSQKGQFRHDYVDYLDFYYDGDGKIRYYKPQPFKNKLGDDVLNDLVVTFNRFGYEKELEPFFIN